MYSGIEITINSELCFPAEPHPRIRDFVEDDESVCFCTPSAMRLLPVDESSCKALFNWHSSLYTLRCFPGVSPTVEKAKQLIAIGGGRVIDYVRYLATQFKNPYIVIPTILSTDAPYSCYAVLYDGQGHMDRIMSEAPYPERIFYLKDILSKQPEAAYLSGIYYAIANIWPGATQSNPGTARYYRQAIDTLWQWAGKDGRKHAYLNFQHYIHIVNILSHHCVKQFGISPVLDRALALRKAEGLEAQAFSGGFCCRALAHFIKDNNLLAIIRKDNQTFQEFYYSSLPRRKQDRTEPGE